MQELLPSLLLVQAIKDEDVPGGINSVIVIPQDAFYSSRMIAVLVLVLLD